MAQDYAKTAEWYEKAAAMDSATAKAQLEKLPIRKAFGTKPPNPWNLYAMEGG